MFNIEFKFSLLGFAIFILPLLINIPFFIKGKNESSPKIAVKYKWIEVIESVTRVLYGAVICFTISRYGIDYHSKVMWVGIIFLILYYVVWIRYYLGGMSDALLHDSFLCVPIPLAVFPVMYYIFGALFLHNYIATVVVIIFGIAHFAVSKLTLK